MATLQLASTGNVFSSHIFGLQVGAWLSVTVGERSGPRMMAKQIYSMLQFINECLPSVLSTGVWVDGRRPINTSQVSTHGLKINKMPNWISRMLTDMTMLLALSVYQLIVTEKLPTTSDAVPLLGIIRDYYNLQTYRPTPKQNRQLATCNMALHRHVH